MSNLIQIFDNLTGETIIREMTQEEQTKWDAQVVANDAAKEAKEEAEAQAAAKKAAAEAKLAALGLTADDLKALGL